MCACVGEQEVVWDEENSRLLILHTSVLFDVLRISMPLTIQKIKERK